MVSNSIISTRISHINTNTLDKSKKFILYCMEASQRVNHNYALFFATHLANQFHKPIITIFNISDKHKFSNVRYYKFMLEGIVKLKKVFESLGIKFIISKSDYVSGCKKYLNDSCAVVLDANYLKTQRKWRQLLAKYSSVAVYEVESDVVIPVKIVSSKLEPYAMTIRPKLLKNLANFVHDDFTILEPKIKSNFIDVESWDLNSADEYIKELQIDKSVLPVSEYYIGGYDEAERRLNEFITYKLHKYKKLRSDPTQEYQSELSPYLHFGQISVVYVLKEILKTHPLDDENVNSFINEIVVWRELARNFCTYNPHYNEYSGIPLWAQQTLNEHLNDKREYIYTLNELENAKTHDEYWNASQIQLLTTGKMHNYMRMYWAKKLIEWTKHPKDAFDIACYLNDKYELDGRDPNGYASISWCFGTHDRPWQERKIFGKVRYMNSSGLERKFDIKNYVKKWLTRK